VGKQKNQALKNAKNMGKAIYSSNFLIKPKNYKNLRKKDKPQMLYKYLIQKNEKNVLIMVKQIEDDIDEDIIKEISRDADFCPI
jgi:nitrogen regulatory protein PII-like uncharacterized protein